MSKIFNIWRFLFAENNNRNFFNHNEMDHLYMIRAKAIQGQCGLLTCFWRLYIVHLNYIMFIFFIDDSKPAAIHTTHQETSSNTDPQLIHLNTFNHYVLYNNFMVLISTYIFHGSRWSINGHVFQ